MVENKEGPTLAGHGLGEKKKTRDAMCLPEKGLEARVRLRLTRVMGLQPPWEAILTADQQ